MGVELPDSPWSSSSGEVAEGLQVDPDVGLSRRHLAQRRKRFGRNRLREPKRVSVWRIFLNQFKGLIIPLLLVASALSFAFGENLEGIAIVVVIVINTLIGFATELRAVRSMEALQKLGSVESKVIRGEKLREVNAQDLVPGDIVMLEAGDVVTADLRLAESYNLQADESTLTGESVPVGKVVDRLEEDTILAERTNMLFKGTAVTMGSGKGIVVATGMATELGQISSLVEEAEGEKLTPLERSLNRLANRLVWITIGIAALLAASGILAGRNILLMVKTSIALAVASIPEGLPIVATIALARGMWRMARRNALVNRLSTVETLGSTNVICTDKTGTLTENRMGVEQIQLWSRAFNVDTEGHFRGNGKLDPLEDSALRRILTVGSLCSNAEIEESEGREARGVGDPLEIALLAAANLAGLDRQELLDEMPEVREEAFNPEVKMMATFHRRKDRYFVAVKGAPEAVIDACDRFIGDDGEEEMKAEQRNRWLGLARKMAGNGLRTLAMAHKEIDSLGEAAYDRLTLIGLVGLLDPPRRDVAKALETCRDAGIGVVMVTGDQPEIAVNIALATGLTEKDDVKIMNGDTIGDPRNLTDDERERLLASRIFARVSPKEKLRLVEIFQAAGYIVAMTGDGVNDAPALRRANTGIAMGRHGTEVAREAADMILKDDSFATIVEAVKQGRIIFDNIRKFALYLLSCNMSEILSVAVASWAGLPLPLLPLQILFLNMVTDVFPAMALGVGEGDSVIMEQEPRGAEEPILARGHWLGIGGYGVLIALAVLGSLLLAMGSLGMDEGQAVTVSFLTLAFAQLWHVFNMRDPMSGFIKNEITRNRYVWAALVGCSALLIAVLYIPGLAAVLKITDPGLSGWILILVMSLIPLAVGQAWRLIRDRRAPAADALRP